MSITVTVGPDYKTGEYPEGAYCVASHGRYNPYASLYSEPEKAKPYVFLTRYEGCVLADRERNGYHDSDFYAIVWDWDKGRPTTIEYATTRFPSYGCSCSVDATDEVIAAYKAWQAKVRKEREIAQAEAEAKQQAADREATGLSEAAYARLYAGCGSTRGERLKGAVTLLTTLKADRFRSKFRRSLAQQIWDWCQDDAPKYDTPLSRNQWGYACQTYGPRYKPAFDGVAAGIAALAELESVM